MLSFKKGKKRCTIEKQEFLYRFTKKEHIPRHETKDGSTFSLYSLLWHSTLSIH